MKKIGFYILLLFFGTAGAQNIVVPDANFMAKLLASSLANDIAKNSDGNAIAIDADGNGIISEGEAGEVRELNVSGSGISSMVGIEYFINLIELDCATNVINGILDISALEDLRRFYCSDNNITSIIFAINNDIRRVNCSQNQLESLLLTNLSHLEVLDCGANLLTVLDVTGLGYLEELKCYDNNLTSLNLNTNTALNFLTCYDNDLITLFLKNGQNETFDPANWSGNLTLEYICADESQVATIQANSLLPVTTQVNSYCSYEPGGIYNRITGVVKYDANNNGNCSDTVDYVIPSLRLKISAGGYEDDIFTKTDGSYVFYVGVEEYSVEPVFENNYFIASPNIAVTNFLILNGGTETKNFCVIATAENHPDVEVLIAPVTNAQPGFNATYKMVYKNKGNQVITSGDVTCYWDSSKLNYVYMFPMANDIGIDTYTWDYNNLKPFESREITMKLNVNSSTSNPPVYVDDVLEFAISVNPGTDDAPEDNNFDFNQVVVGSLDTNNIVCVQGDLVSPGAIGDYLYYIVNFENTGTTMADFVVVEMEVNPDEFDISTLRLINSSHGVTARVNNNKVTFRIENAALGVADHGNILFKQKTKINLMDGASVTTTAKVYFDYNFPIQTNNAITTFETILGNDKFTIDKSVTVYPNPVKGLVRIDADTAIRSIYLFDIQGRQLQVDYMNETNTSFDLSNRAVGIYFLKIITDKGVKLEKLLKE